MEAAVLTRHLDYSGWDGSCLIAFYVARDVVRQKPKRTCIVGADFKLCLHFQTQDVKDHTHVLSSEKRSSSPKKQRCEKKTRQLASWKKSIMLFPLTSILISWTKDIYAHNLHKYAYLFPILSKLLGVSRLDMRSSCLRTADEPAKQQQQLLIS